MPGASGTADSALPDFRQFSTRFDDAAAAIDKALATVRKADQASIYAAVSGAALSTAMLAEQMLKGILDGKGKASHLTGDAIKAKQIAGKINNAPLKNIEPAMLGKRLKDTHWAMKDDKSAAAEIRKIEQRLRVMLLKLKMKNQINAGAGMVVDLAGEAVEIAGAASNVAQSCADAVSLRSRQGDVKLANTLSAYKRDLAKFKDMLRGVDRKQKIAKG